MPESYRPASSWEVARSLREGQQSTSVILNLLDRRVVLDKFQGIGQTLEVGFEI